MSRTPIPPTTVWLFRICLVALAGLIGLGTAEVGLRILGVSHPRVSRRHDFRGTAYRPHVEWVQSGEGFAHIRTNSAGFRDDEWTIDTPDDTLRIAVLGDSYVDALQVEEPDRFSEQLGVALAPCAANAGQAIQVMNFGQSGYGTAQELMTYRHDVSTYAPDLVILAFLPHNDLRNNSRRLQGDPGRPYFQLVDGQLTFDDSFRETSFHAQPLWKRLANAGRDYLRVFQLLHNTKRTFERRREAARRDAVAEDLTPRTEQAELGLDDMSYLEPSDPTWQEAWAVTEAIIVAMADDVRSAGAGFVVVTVTAGDQVHPDPEERRRFAEALGVPDLLYADRRIARLGATHDFPVVALGAPFQAHAQERHVHLHGFDRPGSGHWNQEGHRLAGELIASDVCQNWTRLFS